MKFLTETIPPCLLSEGNLLQGILQFKSETSVFCSIEGEIQHVAKERLHFGKSSFMKGKVLAVGPVIVEGKVEGEITSETLVHLSSSAKVYGRITAPSVCIQPGALLEGTLKSKRNLSR